MAELINNRQKRQEVLKEIIGKLHRGASVDDVKAKFERLISEVSAAEISQMEQALMDEGLPVEEIQRLCDVHASVFQGSVADIHAPGQGERPPGHPLVVFAAENRGLKSLLHEQLDPELQALRSEDSAVNRAAVAQSLERLREVDKHYGRKENLLFPFLEKHGITGPPQVMWGVDDEIRQKIKNAQKLSAENAPAEAVVEAAEQALKQAADMIQKETDILFPLAEETLSEDEWVQIAASSLEIGFFAIEPPPQWSGSGGQEPAAEKERASWQQQGLVSFDAGALSSAELNAMFNTLPLDITFVDKDDKVKYFTQGRERIFDRPKTILGRSVSNCHPPASVHVVEAIVSDFKSGAKDSEDFWIQLGERFVLIRYYAVRDKDGGYLGTMEITQDIKDIQALEGEKRLLS